MVRPWGNFVGTELPRLFDLQSCCLQPGMDHADEWCESTWRVTHSDTSDTHSTDSTDSHASDASDPHSNAADRKLCAGA